jgi:RNA polymerase sigma-70 factor (ECF subfamily)
VTEASDRGAAASDRGVLAPEARAPTPGGPLVPPGEGEILAALDRGELRTALAGLMDLYGTGVFRYACRLLGDHDLAQDVLQTTFLQAYQDLPHYARRASLRVWLFGIGRHRCLDALKAMRRRRRRFPALPEAPLAATMQNPPQASIEIGGLARAIERCLGELKPEARAAVLLRYRDELSYAEMSDMLGEQPATLQARVTRALPVLRRCIERQGVRP